MSNSVNAEAAPQQTQETAKQLTPQQENFAKLRQQAEKAAAMAEQERQARLQLEEKLRQFEQSKASIQNLDEDEEDDEPYVDRKKLKKVLLKEREQIKREAVEEAKRILEAEKQKDFLFRLKSEYRDFDEVLNPETADKFANEHPDLASEILTIPDEYQRRKMAYQTIRSLGIHKKAEAKQSNFQERVQQNMSNPYYRPTNIAPPPQQNLGDFSPAGQKAAWEKMKQLQSKIGYR